MALDRVARGTIKEALISYMNGEIGSYVFNDKISGYQCKNIASDESVHHVARFLYLIYDDCYDHPVSVNNEGWAILRRILAFLSTDLEMTVGKWQGQSAWPFADEEEWRCCERYLDNILLPDYNPAIHGRPANPWWNRIPTLTGLAVIGVGVMFLLLVAYCINAWM